MEQREYHQMYEFENNYWWYKTLHNLVEKLVVNHNTTNKGARIFDAGCGTGRMLELLNKFGDIEGIDCSEEAIYHAKKRGLLNVSIGDLNDWSFAEETIDILICLDVIYHTKIINDIGLLKSFHKALKKDGILILNVPAFDVLMRQHDKVVSTKRRYNRKVLVNELRVLGFNIELSTYRCPHLFLIILIKKAITKLLPFRRPSSDLKSIPSWINNLFIKLGTQENKFIMSNYRIPFGSSVFIVAKKEG